MSNLRKVLSGQHQEGLKMYKKGGLVEGSAKEEKADKKQGGKENSKSDKEMKCGGEVKKGKK
jgi:hypothetical protein